VLGAGNGLPPSFADVVESVNPAVVLITVIEGAAAADESTSSEDAPEEEEEEGPGPRRGEGSGFIVDPQGYILTNHHVVASSERVRVRLADKREFHAVLAGSDPSTDLALLKVNATGLPYVRLGDSDRVRVGEWVCAIGNPYRFDHSVTVGVVSSKGRKIYDASCDAYLQTAAAINPGNSGGPLINAAGQAVGINAAVSVQGQGIGFAIPINIARDILDQLRTRGHVTRGYLGIQLQDLDPDLDRLVGMKEPKGAMVLEVLEDGPGRQAGLKRYDVITAVSGKPIDDGDQLVRSISGRTPGSEVELTVFRDGRALSVKAHLTERAGIERPAAKTEWLSATTATGDILGLHVGEVTRHNRSQLRIPEDRTGVMIREVVGLSPGLEQLNMGDVVVEVNRQPTPSLEAYRKALGALVPGESAWVFVYRPRAGNSFLAKLEAEEKP